MELHLNKELAEQALIGGAFLGGGGGGNINNGRYILEECMKYTDAIHVVDLADLPDEAVVLTAAMVGAPSAKERYVDAEHWKRIYEQYRTLSDATVCGFISNENGGGATANGWLLSAITGIPMVDAPCNGRAQPFAPMASMTLATLPDYHSVQVCAGGKGARDLLSVSVGTVEHTSPVIRSSAVEAGGCVAVVRNPVTAAYLQKNAAVGGLSHAVEVGGIFRRFEGDAKKILQELDALLGTQEVCRGVIQSCELHCEGGFDRGAIRVSQNGKTYEMTYWNEYMTTECDGRRIGTYPDLLATLEARTGLPVPSAEVCEGQEIIMTYTPKTALRLGAGMFIQKFYKRIEQVVGKELISYSFAERECGL